MQSADIIIAVFGTGLAAWLFDAMTGRRGLFAALLVAGTGAIAGWFLAVRVFAVASMDQWLWVAWALGGAVVSLVCFLLFRSKR
ncbi:MAG: transglycosylase [Brevundimonas sp.]|nr:MAG: transglycosylase [Brevundimonas sp.]